MPLHIENDYAALSLEQIAALQCDGWSVMKTPHVGNQHPSNLLCAARGIHCNMVSFTRGDRDCNFHPHIRIEGGEQHPLYEPTTWTPFARVDDTQTAESYHQSAVQRRFRNTTITTDHELMRADMSFTETVLRVITELTPNLWYRSVSSDGTVQQHRDTSARWDTYADTVFRVSSDRCGWIIPNRAAILHDLVWQSRVSKRDTVYHLSGPQMVGYIGGHVRHLSRVYDALRRQWPDLPEVLTVRIVPVAQCRFVAHTSNTTAIDALSDAIAAYERTEPAQRRYARADIQQLGSAYPELVQPIEAGRFMSQYDVDSGNDVYVPPWLVTMPLSRVRAFASMLKCA